MTLYSFVHLISWIMHFSYICFPCAPTLGEPCWEEHHCRGPKGFQQTRTCAAPVIGEQQLDPSASGPFRRQEALSSVGQRTILHSSAKVSGCHAMTQSVMFIQQPYIDVSGLSSLEQLDLTSVKLETLHEDSLRGLKQLKLLAMRHLSAEHEHISLTQFFEPAKPVIQS